ncbi:MAG: ABC transporter permease, partial [Anaerolineales bacterium]
MQTLLQDLRYGARMLAKNPGFTAVAVITLALGIAANTAIFSVVSAVLFRPLPYTDAGRLAVLWTHDPARQIHEALVSFPNYEDWQRQTRVFVDLAFSTRNSPVTLTGSGEPERLDACAASANLFSVLGIVPALGRTFSAEEAGRGERVVVLSYALWQRRLGGAADVRGRTIEIDGRATTIIGVMPPSFQFPSGDVQLWQPLRPNTARGRPLGLVVGRLKPQTTFSEAQAEMHIIGSRLAQQYPELAHNPDFAGFRVNVVPLKRQIISKPIRTFLWILVGAVVFVLLIACANVANLLLARGTARQCELAVRAALGASRSRLIGQLLIEALALASVAGLLGVMLAAVAVRAIVALAPTNVPRLETAGVDAQVLAFNLVVSVLSCVAFGLVPAWQASQSDPNHVLNAGGRGLAASARGRRTQRLLVAGEFALALLLLCGAGLLVRSFLRLQWSPLGFRPENVLVFRVVLPETKNEVQRAEFFREALEHLESLPGVKRAGAISNLFLSYNPDNTIVVEGRANTAYAGEQVMDDAISPGALQVLGVTLRRGRSFTEQDSRDAPHVA